MIFAWSRGHDRAHKDCQENMVLKEGAHMQRLSTICSELHRYLGCKLLLKSPHAYSPSCLVIIAKWLAMI